MAEVTGGGSEVLPDMSAPMLETKGFIPCFTKLFKI